MPSKKHKVLITNPLPRKGQPDVVVKGITAKGYIIVPIEASLFEVYMGKKYLGEAETMAQVKKLIKRDGADAPVLIQNPNGGYEMYSYNRPSSNPKKNPKKNPKAKKKAKKRPKKKAPRKKKATKKAKKKTSPAKKKRISKAKKKVKKAKKKVKSAKKKAKSAKKKVSKAKKTVRKARGALSKAKRSKNPTPNPHKRKKAKKSAKVVARRAATPTEINAYVKRITGKKF